MNTLYEFLCHYLAFLGPIPHGMVQRYLGGPVTAQTIFPSTWRDRRGRTVRVVDHHLLRRVCIRGLDEGYREYGCVYAVQMHNPPSASQPWAWSFEAGKECSHLYQAALALVLQQGFTLGDFVDLICYENRTTFRSWDLYHPQSPLVAPSDLRVVIKGLEYPVRSLWLEAANGELASFCQYSDPNRGPVTCLADELPIRTTLCTAIGSSGSSQSKPVAHKPSGWSSSHIGQDSSLTLEEILVTGVV